MAGLENRGYLIAAGVAVLGGLAMGRGMADHEPDPPRYYGGPKALWHIPDGEALPHSEPVRIEIPDLGIEAKVVRVGTQEDGSVEVPSLDRPHHAGWYGKGPAPGSRGSAVVLGHYDGLTGKAVFYKLNKAEPGTVIRVVRRDGGRAMFKVDASEQVRKADFPRQRVYGPVRYAGLRLVTCGGPWDSNDHTYRDNVIVYAHYIGSR